MKILFSVPRYHPNHDGMVAGLLAAGHEVVFLVRASSPTERHAAGVRVLRLPGAFTETRVEGYAEPAFYRDPKAAMPAGFLSDLLGREKPDLVIARNPSKVSHRLFLACHARRIPFLLYVLSPTGYEQLPLIRRLQLAAGRWPRHTINTVCRKLATPVRGKTFDFIPFAIETYDLGKTDYPAGPPIRVLAIGKLDQARKNNIELVRALAPALRRGEVTLTIAGLLGTSPGPVWQALQDEIAAQALSGAVHIAKNLSFDATRRLYLAHDLFVMPSIGEPAGIAPVEAMASGLAVITSSDSGTRYFVEPGETGFVFPAGDFDDLARRVAYFVAAPAELARMGRNGRRSIARDYSPARFETRLMDIYRRHFGEPEPPS